MQLIDLGMVRYHVKTIEYRYIIHNSTPLFTKYVSIFVFTIAVIILFDIMFNNCDFVVENIPRI